MKIALLLGLALLFVGCTHTRIVESEHPKSYRLLNKRAARHPAVVTLIDGRKLSAQALQVTPDSISWINPRLQSVVNVATTEVAEIRFKRFGRGALSGLGIGFLSGAIAGVVLGIAEKDNYYFNHIKSEDLVVGLGVGFGVLGGLGGLLIGGGVGNRDIYRFKRANIPDE